VAAEKGASKVISIDRQPVRLELARQCGATDVIDMNELTTPDARVQRVKELTDGRGADVVVEVVGIAAATLEGLDLVRLNGTFVDIGNIVPEPVSFPAIKVITQQIQLSARRHQHGLRVRRVAGQDHGDRGHARDPQAVVPARPPVHPPISQSRIRGFSSRGYVCERSPISR
jgi:threonine dehydrogenase-like Zn-dependent dehydrogenase